MSITNEEIAGAFEEIAELLEIKGENPFKICAYSNASRIISQLSGNLEDLNKKEELTDIAGIGKDLSLKIEELLKTGHLAYLDELKKSIPEGIFELLKIRGLGPKKAKALYEKFGIKNLTELENALLMHKLSGVSGFKEKTIENLIQSVNEYKLFQERYLFYEAQPEAELIVAHLQNTAVKLVSNIEVAGSLRRKLETVGDIDIIASTKDTAALIDLFLKYNKISRVESKGETKVSVVLKSGIHVDLRIVPEEDYIYALHHFTGSKLHNEELRGLEKKKGYKISEYGIFKDGVKINVKSEEEIYRLFGMQYIPPELREGIGEINEALKRNIPELIKESDIKGIFHVHTTYTDGKNSLEEMILSSLDIGYKYIGVSDHSASAYYANGLSGDGIMSQIKYIDRLNEKYEGKIKIFKGVESDILPDGSLDYKPSVLSHLDFVIASVHSSFNMTELEMTERIIKAIKNPYTTMIGHLTGRLLLERKSYYVNIPAVIDYASEYKTIIELNANPKRLDIDWRYIKEAISKSVMISINPDAHSKSGLFFMQYGINIARKGWATKKDVLNTYSANEILDIIKRIREFKSNKLL
jgi:DNA polymerase (family 10)